MSDLGLQALLKSAEKLSLNLRNEFISKAYEIEKKYQFDKDRDQAVKDLEALLNNEADLLQSEEL